MPYIGKEPGSAPAPAVGGGSDQVFIENQQVVINNYVLPTNMNAVCVGPITLNAGVQVTIPAGSRWVIL